MARVVVVVFPLAIAVAVVAVVAADGGAVDFEFWFESYSRSESLHCQA